MTDQGLVYQAWSVKHGVPTSLGRMWGMGSASWLILPGNPSDLGSLKITSERASSVRDDHFVILAQA